MYICSSTRKSAGLHSVPVRRSTVVVLGGSTVQLTRVECRPALFLVLGQMYTQPTLPSCLFLGLHTRHRVGVALFGQAHTIASDLRVAGSRYALGPYTPVDPSFVSFSLSLPLSFLAGDTDIRRHSPIPRKCAISLHHSILIILP